MRRLLTVLALVSVLMALPFGAAAFDVVCSAYAEIEHPGAVRRDPGTGDGPIPATAAKKYGARGVGIDIDPQRFKEANENVARNGVGDKVRIIQGDLFEANISEATVVTLYLLPSLNQKLMPKLMKDLKPGTRIVSHAFDMGEWKPEQELDVNGRKVYYWTIPKK